MSGSNKVQIEVTSDDTQLIHTWQKQNLEIIKNQRALMGMGDAGEKAGRKITAGMNGSIGSAKQFIQAIAGVSSIVGGVALISRQLRQEYDALLQRQKTAADRQVDYAGAVSQTVRNAAGLLSGQEVEGFVTDISAQTGVQKTKTAMAMGAAFSARGATKRAQVLESVDATRAALKYAPELEAEGVASLAGVAIDVSKREKVSPEAAIGFIQNIGGLARVTDLKNLVENVAPAVNNLGNFGFTPAQAGSLVSTLTQGTGDFTGSISRTAALNFGQSLRKAYPNDNPIDVIQRLRNNPRERAKFLDEGVFGKGVAKPSIENILTSGTIEAIQFDEGPEKIGSFEKGRKTYDEVINEINSLSAVRNAKLKRTLDTAAESLSISDISGGKTGIIREGMRAISQASGDSAVVTSAQGWRFDLFEGGLQGAATTEKLIGRFRQEAKAKSGKQLSSPGFGPSFREANAEELNQAKVLSTLADTLQQMLDQDRTQKVEVTNDPVAERGKATRKPAAAANSR